MRANHFIKSRLLTFTLLLSLLNISPVFSQEDPVAMLNKVTSSVMKELKEHQSELRRNPDRLYSLVDHLILPHVDFVEMSRWVVGRNAWGKSDSDTQKQFINEFKTLVVRSYARALLEYTDQEIQFLPLRNAIESQRIQVSSLIKESGRAPVRMDYRLIQASGTWRVYDIIVEGVSLMQGYRAQFADDLRMGGLEKVTQKIRRKNGH